MKAKYFLKWWLCVCLIAVGVVLMGIYGMFDRINQADITKISFAIFVLFCIFSIKLGVLTFKIDKTDRCQITTIEWFAEKFITLGMIGTVIGFLYTLNTVFCKIDVSNVNSMQSAISNMAQGMGTALYTTAAGLICSFLLKLQIYNLDMGLSCKTQDF